MRNIKRFIVICFLIGCCISCIVPKHFTYLYTGEYTGLDTLINTQGYFYFSACNDFVFHIVMFYNDGIFKNAFFSEPQINEYGLSRLTGAKKDKTPAWGTYRIAGDTIKTQGYLNMGPIYGRYIQFRDYLILPDKSLSLISQYMLLRNGEIDPEYKGYNFCNPSTFHYLETKADSTESILLKKRWFRGK